MSTQKVYYPHGIYFGGGTEITVISDMTPTNGYSDLTEYSASEAGPQFAGTHQAMPDVRFTSQQAGTIFGQMASAVYDVIKDYSAGDVKIEYKAGQNLGVRIADNGGAHIAGTLAENSALIWESFRVRQGGLVEIQCRLAAIYKASTASDPIVFGADDSNLTITSAVPALFTLGTQKINGTALSGVEELEWNNNIEYEEVFSDGEAFMTYLAVKRMRPVARIMLNDVERYSAFGTRGTNLTDYTCFLRKKSNNNINVADATAEHIKLVATTGSVKAQSIAGSKGMVSLEVAMTSASQGTGPFAITSGVAIS